MTIAEELVVSREGDGRRAIVYRMVTDEHVCPFGIKAVDLLERKGYDVEDHHLANREETDRFQEKWDVSTTPQAFIGQESEDARVGGYEALRRHFGFEVADDDEVTYTPVIVVFIMAALMAVAAIYALTDGFEPLRTVEWFVAFSMAMLAMLKLRDIESFSNMFVGYDVLARRVVRYAYVYPFAEAFAAVAMIAGGTLGLVSAPVALFIGSIGAWSVIKAVYIEKRELKCACVGGGTNVPLGFVSLSENLAMIGMGVWMIVKHFVR